MKYLVILSLLSSQNLLACYLMPYRNSFSISVNKNNDLQIENELHDISELGDMLYHYYTDNSVTETEKGSATYSLHIKENCLIERKRIEESIKSLDRSSASLNNYQTYLKKWDRSLFVMNYLNLSSCMFMDDNAYVQIKMRSASSYNTYIQVLTEIKKTIYKLRDEKAKKLFNVSYRTINVNQKMSIMRKRLYVLRLLVPERIMDMPILN